MRIQQRVSATIVALMFALSVSATTAPQERPSHSEILQSVSAAKAFVESTGEVFSTEAQVSERGFSDEDRLRAVRVTVLAAADLAQRYPNVGLEFYDGASGIVPPGGLEPISFDIILLTRSGPSVDILRGGVTPQVLIDDSTDADQIAAWQRDWRPALAVDPPPPGDDDDPPADDPPDSSVAEAVLRIEAALARIEDRQAALERIEEVVGRIESGSCSDILAQLEELKQVVAAEREIELSIRFLGTARGRIKPPVQ